MSDVCYLCLRIDSNDLIRELREKGISHKIASEVVKFIEYSYKKDPIFWCGKPRKSIVSSLVYLFSILEDERRTQTDLSRLFEVDIVTIRANYRRAISRFDAYFKNYHLKGRYF